MDESMEMNIRALQQTQKEKELIQESLEKDLQAISNKMRKAETSAEDRAVKVVSQHESQRAQILTVRILYSI